MAEGTIDNLSIQVTASADKAARVFDRLASAAGRLKGAASGVAGSMNKIGDSASRAADGIGKISEAVDEMGTATSKSAEQAGESIEEIKRKVDSVNKQQYSPAEAGVFAYLKKDSDVLMMKLEAAKARLADLLNADEPNNRAIANSMVEVRRLADAYIKAKKAEDEFSQGAQDMRAAAWEAGEQAGEAQEKIQEFGDASEEAGENSKKGASMLSRFWNGLRRIGSGAGSVIGKIGELRNHFGGGLTGAIKQSVSGLGNFFSSIKRIAYYRAIRSAIKLITQGISDGMKNLYYWSQAADKTFAKSMDKITTASKYMGNSFAAMISPLINALAPVIDFIADKIVDLFNLINQVFARLTGQTTYTAARKVAAEWQESSDKTRNAVKEMRRTILGFDEINRLNGNSGSGSGSGNNANTDYSNMFETRTIEGGVASFVDSLKQAFTSGDWQTIGTLIGTKINGLIESVDFAGIGSTVGYYINGLFSTKYWTLDAINFTNIGASIAEFLNNAIKNIDFGMIARSWVQDLTIIADTLIGFFTNFDFGQLAGKLSDFAVNFFDEVTRWLNTVDWYELGQTVWTKITDFFANIDYEQLFTSIFTNIGTSIKASNDFLMGILDSIFSWIGQGISDWWDNNIVGQDSGTILTNVLQALFGVNTAISIGKWVTKNIINPLISSLLGIDKEKFDEVTDNLFDGIKESWDRLISLPGKVLNFVVDAFKNPEEWWANVKKWWHETTVGKAVDSFITNPRNTALSWWNSVQAWWHDTTFGKFVDGFLTNVINSAPIWWSNVQHWWEEKVGSVVSFLTSVKDDSKKWWSNVQHWWEKKVGTVRSFLTAVKDESDKWWSNVQHWWEGKVGTVMPFITNVLDTASTWWSNVVSWWEGVVNSSPIADIKIDVLNTVSEWWDQIVEWWNEFVSGKFLGINIGFGDGNSGSNNSGIDSDYNEMLIRRNVADLQWRLNQERLNATVDADIWTPWQYWGVSPLRWMGLENLRTTVTVDIVTGAVRGAIGGLLAGFGRRAKGGVYVNGGWSDIPQYAGGTTNAGSLFMAGEAGPEIVGHVGGRTEVLNKSQIASAIYSAVQAAMAPATSYFAAAAQSISESNVTFDLEMLAEMVRQGVEQAMSRSNDLDRQRNEYLRQINDKDYNVDVSTSSINRSQNRMNRRAGTTIVPVGT